jgi:hypothetical protein
MPKLSAHLRPAALIAALALAGCVHRPVQQQAAVPPPEPAVLPTLPPAFQPGEIVGRWGFAAYHREGDRGRTAAAAKAQCDNPYVIRPGPTGGVMMHLADDAKPSELRLKGAPGGKTLCGSRGSSGRPAGSRSRHLRWPGSGVALDGSGSREPIRHLDLCALWQPHLAE